MDDCENCDISSEEISSLLLNIDDEIELTLQFDDEDELCRLLKEEFILPELPSVEDTTQVAHARQRQSNKKFNQKPFEQKCSKIYLKEHFYKKHISTCLGTLALGAKSKTEG